METVLFKKIISYLICDLPLWMVGLLTNWLPENVIICKLRGLLMMSFFKNAGKNLQIGMRVRFINPQNISIGDNVYLAQECWVNGKGGIVFENNVTLGPRCGVVTTKHRYEKGIVLNGIGAGEASPIKICEGSWLGMYTVVTGGISIGKGNIVAAHSVVTKDTPDFSLVGGVPARVIKNFEAE
jgi:acetyltransferase-like isoleucine patch superfamily enzyme